MAFVCGSISGHFPIYSKESAGQREEGTSRESPGGLCWPCIFKLVLSQQWTFAHVQVSRCQASVVRTIEKVWVAILGIMGAHNDFSQGLWKRAHAF